MDKIEIKLTVNKKLDAQVDLNQPFYLFGARYHTTMVNFGNYINFAVTGISFNEAYENKFGKVLNQNSPNKYYPYQHYGTFLYDCIKYSFKIKKINGISVDINPYTEIYAIGLNTGDNEIIIEIE